MLYKVKNIYRTIKKEIKKCLVFLIVAEVRFRNLFIKKRLKRLIIVKIDAIGDFILFSPFIPAYAELYKDYKISLVVNSLCLELAKKVCTQVKQIDNIIPFDYYKFNNNLLYRRKVLRTIQKEESSIAIQPTFSRVYIGDLFIKLSGAMERIGYKGDLNNITAKQKSISDGFYTKLIVNDNRLRSEIDINKHFLTSVGGKIENPLPHLKITDEEKEGAKKILEENGLSKNKKYVLIQLGAGASCRRWPILRFAEIIKYLTEEKGLFCVIIGSPKEKELSIKLLAEMHKEKSKIIDLIGKINLIELSAIADGALLYFGNDTGPMHICAAVDTPIICIMGGGHFGRFFPYGNLEKNRIVYDKNMKCMNDNWLCGKNLSDDEPAPCIANIAIPQVKSEINTLLKNISLMNRD